jgi:hypothetical protein
MSNTATARQFKILGITDFINSCDCCGKQGLQKTVAIENCETGEIGHFGTSCAMQPSKCFGFEKSEMARALSFFKAEQQIIWAKTRALYKAKGGKMVAYDDRLTGGSMGLRYADIPLRDECELEVRLTRNKMTPIFAK